MHPPVAQPPQPRLLPLVASPPNQKAARKLLVACCGRRAIAKAGAIPPLVALLGEGSSEGSRQEAARALSNLSCNNEDNQGVSM